MEDASEGRMLFLFDLFMSQYLLEDEIPADEWNLVYVAVTRARRSLVFTSTVLRLLNMAGVGRVDHCVSFLPSLLLWRSLFGFSLTFLPMH